MGIKRRNASCRGGCKDKDLTDHYGWGGCGTPLCSGMHEIHCRRCGWFTCQCQCGCENVQSKMPDKWWRSRQSAALSRLAARPADERRNDG